jgi:hypothetical protein
VRFEAYARSASAAMAKLEQSLWRHMVQHPYADPWEVVKKVGIEGRLLDQLVAASAAASIDGPASVSVLCDL